MRTFLEKIINQLSQLAKQAPKSTNSLQPNISFRKNSTLFTMKTFIVLFAVVAVASSSAINRAAGWGSPGNLPSINIDLAAAAAAAASGQASANQALAEAASGNIDGPAYIQSISGVLASVSQDEEISQVATADKPSGATSTINVADVNNLAIGLDTLYGQLGGAFGAAVLNSAESQSSGEGSAAEEASSSVAVVENPSQY